MGLYYYDKILINKLRCDHDCKLTPTILQWLVASGNWFGIAKDQERAYVSNMVKNDKCSWCSWSTDGVSLIYLAVSLDQQDLVEYMLKQPGVVNMLDVKCCIADQDNDDEANVPRTPHEYAVWREWDEMAQLLSDYHVRWTFILGLHRPSPSVLWHVLGGAALYDPYIVQLIFEMLSLSPNI
jgi:hypothetical protein